MLINNESANSQQSRKYDGKEVTTIEGLMKDGELDVVQRALQKKVPFTADTVLRMIMSLCVAKNPRPTRMK